MPRYFCLIPDTPGKCVLIVPAGDGRWTLPAFEQHEAWFAYASVAIARDASERYGVLMTALHERSIDDCPVCELEIQASSWTPPAEARWIAHRDLAATVLEPAALSAVLEAWFLERQSGTVPGVRPLWERRGWYAQANEWIVRECARLGCAPTGPVEQVKAVWSLSAILRVQTSAGCLYFKADWEKPPAEPAVIAVLAQRWPGNVPTVIATDQERRWMLMRDFGQRALDNEPVDQWLAANRKFSAMQIACSADLEPWWRLGCADFRVPALAAHMEKLLNDRALDGFPQAMTAQLQALAPQLRDMCRALDAIPIPVSIVQQDFRSGNVAIFKEEFVFYDWSDTVIGHPFFACCRFLNKLPGNPGPHLKETQRRIADAYLQSWTQFASAADLRRAFELVWRLDPLYMAIRWYLDARHCEPSSHWGRMLRDSIVVELRRLLGSMHQPVPLF